MELRKRKAPPAPAPPPPAPKRGTKKNTATKDVAAQPTPSTTAASDATSVHLAGIPASDVPSVTHATVTDAPTAAPEPGAADPEPEPEPAIAYADDAPVAAAAAAASGVDTTDANAAAHAPAPTTAETSQPSLSTMPASSTTSKDVDVDADADAAPDSRNGTATLDAVIEAPGPATPTSGTESTAGPASSAKTRGPPQVGSCIDPVGFGGDILLDDGTSTNFAELLRSSGGGVVVFTYPKANTPGCTKQACLFRDHHTSLTTTSTSLTTSAYTIYGLSRDTPKSNTSFKKKYALPYTLISDPAGTLLRALGFAKANSAVRGVVVVKRDGEVLEWMVGGSGATVEAAGRVVGGGERGF